MIVFAGINHHLHSRGLLSRLREPATVENLVCLAIKDVLESMGEIMQVLKEGGFQKITPKPMFVFSVHLPDGLKIVYAIVTLVSESKYDVIIPAPNLVVKARNLRPFLS